MPGLCNLWNVQYRSLFNIDTASGKAGSLEIARAGLSSQLSQLSTPSGLCQPPCPHCAADTIMGAFYIRRGLNETMDLAVLLRTLEWLVSVACTF